MNIRCLIIESKNDFREELELILKESPSVLVESTDSTYEAIFILAKFFPNIIFLSCHSKEIHFEQIFAAIQRTQMRTVVIPLIGYPVTDLLHTIMQNKYVIDMLMDDAHPRRIRDAILKAIARISGDDSKISDFRGFIGFVGVIPTLRERKIIQKSKLGIIHNRSMRLAIDYWRKNPNSQLIAVVINSQYRLTNRNDDEWQCLMIADSKPWEIAMFEAQNHYMQYWKDAITCGLLNPLLSTIIYSNPDNYEVLDPEDQRKILIKVGNKAKNESFDENFKSLGIPFQVKNDFVKKTEFTDFIKGLERQIENVSKQFPQLTNPIRELINKESANSEKEPFLPPLPRTNYIIKKE